MSDSETAPAVRAPSSRASKGNRMARLLAQEEDAAEEGDKDFYEQDFWADAEGDAEYAMDADDEQGNDSFDSDFGDSSESDDDDDEEGKAEKAVRAVKPKKRSVYTDPNAKDKAGASSFAPKRPRKRPQSELSELTGLQPIQRGSLRASTKDATAAAQEKQKLAVEMAERRAGQAIRGAKFKGVELRRLTQEEILEEAEQTEIINRASLEKMLRVEEEKRKVMSRVHDHAGPRVRQKSIREGDSIRTYVTFTHLPLPPALDDVAPPYPAQAKCAVTGVTARYFDPATRSPYATLEAFRTLRGERRVRPSAA